MTVARAQFTPDIREWHAWLEPVKISEASTEQQAALEEGGPHVKNSEFGRLLVRDVASMRERGKLLNQIMYGNGGLPRAERELAATAESLRNGCVYCYSVHARLYIQLTKQAETIAGLGAHGFDAALDARQRAIVDFSVKLAATPPTADGADIASLRSAGLTDFEILDLVHVVAIFAWATRVLQTLGSSVVIKPFTQTEEP
jgi:uncharacterized peroxidase-related enzyme